MQGDVSLGDERGPVLVPRAWVILSEVIMCRHITETDRRRASAEVVNEILEVNKFAFNDVLPKQMVDVLFRSRGGCC